MAKGFAKQFEDIQKDRYGVVHSSVYPGIKELVSEIYPEEAHFIYELLQNAEDAEASVACFEVKKNMLVFKHNGKKLFDAKDVDSITNIAKSTKKENYVQAGKFGIGFKSVYAFTDTPSIYCDSVCFRIDQLLLPVQIPDLKKREKGWTVFHFPFDSDKIIPEEAKEKICQGLIEIENSTLLFLNNIKELNYILEDKTTYRVAKEKNGHFISCSMIKNKSIINSVSWLRFTNNSSLGGKSIQVDVAFLIQKKEDGDEYEFARGDDKVCIKFLAKNEKSNLRFFINAPFGCTPARDTVNKGDKANHELVKTISFLFQRVITELRDDNLLTDSFFEILPIEDDDIPEFYQPIVSAIKRSFSERKNLPTMTEGGYVTAENGIMSRRDVIDKVFTQNDIRVLFDNDNLCFVKNRPINTRAYKFLKSLDIKELSPETVLRQMSNLSDTILVDWLSGQSNEKVSDLYAFLYKGIDSLIHQAEKYEEYRVYVSNSWSRQLYVTAEDKRLGNLYLKIIGDIEKIKKIRIVKTSENMYKMASETYIVEKGIDVPEEYSIVLRDLCRKENAKKFLQLMGTKTFSTEELQEYKYKNEIKSFGKFFAGMQDIENQRNAKPLEIARKVLCFLEKHKYDELKWKEYRIVYARRPDRPSSGWHFAPECCLDKPLIEETGFRYAAYANNKCIVDEVYNELDRNEKRAWIDFLKKSGALCDIKVIREERYTGYSTGKSWDHYIYNLKEYLEINSVELARFIWKSLSAVGGWNHSYAEKYYKLNKNHNARWDESTALKLLKNTKWVPDKNGIFKLPRDLSRDTIDQSFVIDETNGFLSAIRFGENAKRIEELERAKREKAYLEQEKQKEAAKRLGFDSTEEVLALKEESRKVAELRALGIDVDKLIYDEKSKRKEKERKDLETMMLARNDEVYKEKESYDYDVAAIVPNPERRKEKIETELDKEPEEKKKEIGNIQKGQISKEEKQFLFNQYGGKCQVCQKRIVKKDGSYYFEAINLMDTSVLEQKYLTGIDVGWNSLCLCPNCAAEYKYGAVSMYDFKDKVQGIIIDKTVDDYIEFVIKMQGEERILRYSPVHLFALQTALVFFDRKLLDKTNDENTEQEYRGMPAADDLATEILRIFKGDKCPICGNKNTKSRILTVIDNYGNERNIEGLCCECGAKYLTKRLYERLHDSEKLNIKNIGAKDLESLELNTKQIISNDKSASKKLVKQVGGVYIVKKTK